MMVLESKLVGAALKLNVAVFPKGDDPYSYVLEIRLIYHRLNSFSVAELDKC